MLFKGSIPIITGLLLLCLLGRTEAFAMTGEPSLSRLQGSIEVHLQDVLAGRDRRRSDTAIVLMEEARGAWTDPAALQRVEMKLAMLSQEPLDTVGISLLPAEAWLKLEDDGERDSLLAACRAAIRQLRNGKGSVRLGGFRISRKVLLQAQELLLELLEKNLSAIELSAQINRRFQLHRSRGNFGRGRVLFTGYAHPVLAGSLKKNQRFRHPVYGLPGGKLRKKSRSGIMAGGLAGRGLELGWLADPLDVFFLEVQGSGALALEDGRYLHLQYAGQNGHRYVSLGKLLVAGKKLAPWELSIPAIRSYFAAHPGELESALRRNPSAVFFKGTINRSKPAAAGLIPERSLACDRRFYPRGSLLFVDYHQPDETGGLRRRHHFAVSCDTGGAIKGAGHVDVYLGASPQAWSLAGRQRHPGTVYLLLPRGTILKEK